MATNQRQIRSDQEIQGFEDLVTEPEPRWLCHNSGSLQGTLPKMLAEHVGLTAGTPMQVGLYTGGVLELSEPCIVIRPHPIADSDEGDK